MPARCPRPEGLCILDPTRRATDNVVVMIARALTIAGSDSGGGAGIQADLKTFTVFGVFGMSAITALTAQDTRGVCAVHPIPASFVRQQIDAVVSDLGIDAAKTGMLATVETVVAVARAVRDHCIAPLVVDPVLMAHDGTPLLHADAREALLRELVPLAALVTPNLDEAQALTGVTIASVIDMRTAARVLLAYGPGACLVKGGHLAGHDAVDVFDDGREPRVLTAPRLTTKHTHGTGCQLSAAITANLALGLSLWKAVERSKRFISVAIRHSLAIGHGNGPANPLAWLDSAEAGSQKRKAES